MAACHFPHARKRNGEQKAEDTKSEHQNGPIDVRVQVIIVIIIVVGLLAVILGFDGSRDQAKRHAGRDQARKKGIQQNPYPAVLETLHHYVLQKISRDLFPFAICGMLNTMVVALSSISPI